MPPLGRATTSGFRNAHASRAVTALRLRIALCTQHESLLVSKTGHGFDQTAFCKTSPQRSPYLSLSDYLMELGCHVVAIAVERRTKELNAPRWHRKYVVRSLNIRVVML